LRKEIRIGTRASALALWQAEWVKSELEKKYPGMTVSLTKIKTTGDKILDVPLSKVGGKGLFVKEIEEAMLRSEIDIAVHSMKDVPTFFPDGLHLGCITKREDARDALLSRNKVKFKDLPKGANIGTSSLRRQTQIMNIRPDFVIHQLRGNVDTRLRKLKEGQYDAIILAAAGVKRLGLAENVTEYMDPELSLPAIGQGALGIECRVDDRELNDLIAFFNHAESRVCVTGERALLRRLKAGARCRSRATARSRTANFRWSASWAVWTANGSSRIRSKVRRATRSGWAWNWPRRCSNAAPTSSCGKCTERTRITAATNCWRIHKSATETQRRRE